MSEPISNAQGLLKGRAYCARQERAQQEVRDKLHSWEVRGPDVEAIISQLISEGFLNEARFAEHFAVSKFRQKGWGLRKIEAALKQKRVSSQCIALALAGIEESEYQTVLNELVAKRWHRTKDMDLRVKRQKLFKHFFGKGYSADRIEKALGLVIRS